MSGFQLSRDRRPKLVSNEAHRPKFPRQNFCTRLPIFPTQAKQHLSYLYIAIKTAIARSPPNMAGSIFKKRSRDDAPRTKIVRPTKKQKKQAHAAYHSSSSDASEDEGEDGFQAVNLLDSDEEDIHNAKVDDGADSQSDDDGDSSSSEAEAERVPESRKEKTQKKKSTPSIARDAPRSKLAKDAPASDSEEDDNDDQKLGSHDDFDNSDDDDDDDEYSDLDGSDSGSADGGAGEGTGANRTKKRNSKRNDPEAFATSMSKILGTKLSSSRRADPVLARSAAAHEAGRAAADGALEAKARKKLRDARRVAMEKGRVRDVLVATSATFGGNVNPVTGEVEEEATVAQRLETERRLRKVAQRGVVQLFNAFRTAQVKAAEAERGVRKEGVVGVDRKKEKVAEMSKKGFLDLIAAGGGGLKKGPIEEA